MKTSLPTAIGRPATNALNSAGVMCLEDLTKITENELKELHGFGPKALRIIKDILKSNNLSFKLSKDDSLKNS